MPARIIAMSAITQWAQFFEINPIRSPGPRPSFLKPAASRQASSTASAQVQCFQVRSIGWQR